MLIMIIRVDKKKTYRGFWLNLHRWLILSWKTSRQNFVTLAQTGVELWILKVGSFSKKMRFFVILILWNWCWTQVTELKEYNLSFCIFLYHWQLDPMPLITTNYRAVEKYFFHQSIFSEIRWEGVLTFAHLSSVLVTCALLKGSNRYSSEPAYKNTAQCINGFKKKRKNAELLLIAWNRWNISHLMKSSLENHFFNF